MRRILVLGLAFTAGLAAAFCAAPTRYDVVVRGGTIVDGSGADPYPGDIAIDGDRIMAVGDLGRAEGRTEVDASGLLVAPGFINIHSHPSAVGLQTAHNMLSQGVTTEVLNPDGGGPLDIGGQLTELESAGLALNAGAFIGFNSVWTDVMGREDVRPDSDQIERMGRAVLAGLEAGALGVSSGLDYKPAYYAHVDEVVAVLEPAGETGVVFSNHDRLTPESGFSSTVGMAETIEIGRRTGLVPLITHMKIQGREQGSHEGVLAMMDSATASGTHTVADAYPYLAGQTSLAALIIPGWAQEGGLDVMRARFGDPAQRRRIVAEADEALAARFGGAAGVFLPETQRELTDIMAEQGVRSGGEAVVRILETESPSAILRFGSEEDLVAILRHPTTSVACDCGAAEGRVGHPRYWGSYPRVLGRYVREQGVLSWAEAVRKMTSLPARTVGIQGRGTLAPGQFADVVVFDSATVMDHATYEDPSAASDGIVHVVINGVVAWQDGGATGAQAGRALRRVGTGEGESGGARR